jgi:hypothetical protein
MVMKVEDATHNIIAVNVVPGHSDSQGSYRSELAGLYGIVTLVNVICALHKIQHGSIKCGCDGKNVLDKLSNPEEDANLAGQQFNLLSATKSVLLTSPIKWNFRHVKGHQDDDPDAILDRWAHLNIQMDNLAKSVWQEQFSMVQPSLQLIDGEYWPVFINGRKIHSNLRTTIDDDIYQKKLEIHWEKNDRMRLEQFHLINWEACAHAMKCLRISRRHWVEKHSKGMCGIGRWMLKWKEQDTDECPRCQAPEDARHVWLYPANSTIPICVAAMENLNLWMQSSLTSPDIHLAINTRLAQLFQCLPRSLIPCLT